MSFRPRLFPGHLCQANASHLTKKIHHPLGASADAAFCITSGRFGAVNWRYALNAFETMFHLALQRCRNPRH
jgi:hypothetical protein